MKITSNNYLKEFNKLDQSSLPEQLLKSHQGVMKATFQGTDWNTFRSNENITRIIDLYFEKLTEYIATQKKPGKSEKSIEDILLESPNVRSKVPLAQQRVLAKDHISVIQKLEKQLSKIPKIGAQDGLSNDEIVVHAHYFYGGSDWFVLESNSKNGEMFAYTILNSDYTMSEFGYLTVQELRDNPSVEIDFYWKPKSLAEALHKVDPNFFPAPQKKASKKTTPRKSKNKVGDTFFSLEKAKEVFEEFKEKVVYDFVEHWVIDGGDLLSVKHSIIKLGEKKITSMNTFKEFLGEFQDILGQIDSDKLFKDFHPDVRAGWDQSVREFEKIAKKGWSLLPSTKPDKKNTTRKPVSKKVKVDSPKPVKRLTRKTKPKTNDANKVESVDLELKFIRRFVNMHDKPKTFNQIRLFLNALQRAIVEKVIGKHSKFAKEIMQIQKNLIKLYDQALDSKGQFVTPNIDATTRKAYFKLLGKQIQYPSVQLIKSYIGLQGRVIENKKAENLYKRINRAIETLKITQRDKYWDEIDSILKSLKEFLAKNEAAGVLSIKQKTLNGLNGIVSNYPSKKVHTPPRDIVLRSTDFVNIEFDKLNFKGKWLDFIGNPSRGFTAMTFGKPKMGKSYLMIDFAGYLVRNHGKVLYVAKEEGIEDTLKQKLRDKKVAHPELFVSDYLPADLNLYDFVFIDSVTKMRLKPSDLEELQRKYPNVSFIYVFQTTKHGAFRGNNEFQHDVDVVIEVYERGKATQFGRFNQGGEMNIFNNTRYSI